MTENMENIIVENAEDIITAIPEEIVPVGKSYTGLEITGMAALTLAVGYGIYRGVKYVIPKIKAKKAAKEEENGVDNVVNIDEVTGEVMDDAKK